MHAKYRIKDGKQLVLNSLMSCNDISLDRNDLFVIKHCAAYLTRHLSQHFILDEETMEFICWIIGPDKLQLSEKIIQFASPRDKGDIEEDFLACDADGFARTAFTAIRNMKPVHRNKMGRFILELLETRSRSIKYKGLSDLEKNIKKVKKIFTLSEDESKVVIFFFILSVYDQPENFFNHHLECIKFSGRKYLKNILEIDHDALNRILNGILVKTGMLEMDKYNIELNQEIICALQSPPERNLSETFYSDIPKNTIPMEYHLVGRKKIDHALKILGKKSKTPTHILLYGPPGTGKTSFAYGLSKILGTPAYEIAKGESNQSRERRTAIVACLGMTNGGSGSLLIVDEADNILNTRSSWFKRGETQDKGWLNQLLDEPGVRMIWITNDIEGIEKSVLRRFSFSLKFNPFSRQQRIHLWNNIISRNRCKTFFSEEDIAALAKKHDASPGAIDLAMKKALECRPCSKDNIHQALHLGLEAHRALFHLDVKPVQKDTIESAYSLEGLNIKADLPSLLLQLNRFDQFLRKGFRKDVRNLNLLFYGPPGTGKSELARYLAEHLDRELICKRPSDLLDPYVGVAEKNIRRAFEKAEQEGAVLVLDEVDSLLFPRESAIRSWEISFTNEFLTQMERFTGILICTTNRLTGMDSAAIRRFNQKLGFDYLLPEGNKIFYQKLLQRLVNEPIGGVTEAALMKLHNLSPGDFKTVRDRYAFFPSEELSHEMLLNALKEESSIKDIHKGSKPIGF
jgi:transitional endoplasmic reticulum ATPase